MWQHFIGVAVAVSFALGRMMLRRRRVHRAAQDSVLSQRLVRPPLGDYRDS